MGHSPVTVKKKEWKGAMPRELWVQFANEKLQSFFEQEVIVVCLIGKDLPNRKKYEELNDYLRVDVFPCPSTSKPGSDIEIFYSIPDRTVFILVNSPNDVDTVKNAFSEDRSDKNFFEKLTEIEQKYLHALHLVSLVSHIMVFVEAYPRIDMALIRTLKNVNRIRLAGQNDVEEFFYAHDNPDVHDSEGKLVREGRIALPKFLFAFQKNVIRNELGATKRKELIEKQEEALEDQVYDIFKHCRLIESGNNASLGCIPEKAKYIRLLTPSAANEYIMADLLDFVMDENTSKEEDSSIHEAFAKLLNQNITAVRKENEKGYNSLPMLKTLIDVIGLLNEKLPTEESVANTTNKIALREQKLLKELTKAAVEESVEQYSWSYGKERDRAVFTKAEHNQRFGAAVRYLDGVLVGLKENAMTELRAKCDDLWQGGLQCCEQQSVTGNNCHKAVHSCVGDESVPEKEWEMHDSGVTFISTCTCGRTQTLRKDPFTLKEANYDFYYMNSIFTCCKALERHNFPIVDDFEAEPEAEEAWNAEENWPRVGDEPPSVFPRGRTPLRPTSSEESVNDETGESSSSSASSSSSSSSENVSEDDTDKDDTNREYGGTRRSYVRKGTTKDTTERKQTAVWEFIKKVKDLQEKDLPHTVGVPHSLMPNILPVFPSWSLTCIGPGSIYSHGFGLRDQPNFKISSEFLLPVDIPLLVDREKWEQDLEFVNAVEGVGMYAKYRPNRRPGMDTEKVKLFVGFDYECPRGHRFFVDAGGEPLVLPKGHSAREQACRDAGQNIMGADLPLRRQCTCRKMPNQVAQLMKIHIVTPKSPVSVTIDPKIFIPNQEGYYCTGEPPLKLAWAKYYILHLPFIYDGPHGLWIPPKSFEPVGTYKGNSIQVKYTPLEKK